MKTLATLLVSLAFVLTGASCSKDKTDGDPITPPAISISEAQQAHLLQLYEEEKLAHDIYAQFYAEHAYKPFGHHTDAEATHMGLVNDILLVYNLSAPQNPAGVFDNTDYQKAYDEWLPKGLADGVEACYIGAYIEEMDILDLMNAIENIAEKDDIKAMYETLLSGSENHLRAYNRFLKMQFNIDYQPKLMDQATFDAIIANSGGGHGGK